MSSFFDSASLVQIPSGYSDGTLYSVKPIDGTGDLTFSRGSDIEATRVAANGYIEKAVVNLLLQSNTFNTTWLSSGTTETGGQAGYDGTNDAWLLQRNDGNARFVYQTTAFNSLTTFSVYAKAGNVDWLFLSNGVGENHYFDLANGVLGSTGTAIDATIESAGNGYYRCSIVIANGTEVRIFPAVSDGGVSGLVGANIYIQDAQLNYGLVAQEYQETTTTSVVAGITNDMPRLDYAGGASCPSLLLEPSRQNLVTQSEFFGAWSNTEDTTVSSNNALSPEGVINSSKLIPQATSNLHRISESFTVTPSTPYTFSVFVKKAGYDYFLIRTGDGTNNNVGFDLANGTVTFEASGYSGFIESFGNDWYRVGYVRSFAASAVTIFLRPNPTLVDFTSIPAFTGDGTSGVYIYGTQVEAGSYPTSYLPTYGTSATRTADATQSGTLSAISGGEVSFFLDIDGAPNPSSNSTSANFQWYFTSGHWVAWNNNTTSSHRIRVTSALGNEYFAADVRRDDRCKIVALLTATEAKVYANGVLVGTQTIDADWSTTNGIFTSITNAVGVVPIKQMILFPIRLTDAQAIELTTL